MRRLLVLALLASCAPSPHELRGPVDRDLASRLGGDFVVGGPAATKLVADRLARPLDLDGAIRIALANNARVRAALAELEIGGGGLAPIFGPTTIEAELRRGDSGTEIEVTVIQDLLGAITAARQRSAGRADLVAARATASGAAIRLAGRVERAFYDLLATRQTEELTRTAFEAADAAALLRERMHAAGNTSDLALARDRAAREDARVSLGRAEAAVEIQRETINALLGLTGAQTGWTFDGKLPELPATAPSLDAIEATAVAASLDLAAQRARVGAAAGQVSAQRLRSFLPHLGVGISVVDDSGGTSVGPAIELGIPLFDWNAGARARARGQQGKAVHELTALAIELRASARAARITALASFAEARHLRDVVLPLRQQVVDQTVLHYNAMDTDPFALINARQQLAETGARYIDALRRYAGAMATVRALQRGVLLEPDSAGPGRVDRGTPEAYTGH